MKDKLEVNISAAVMRHDLGSHIDSPCLQSSLSLVKKPVCLVFQVVRGQGCKAHRRSCFVDFGLE
jgi:hypothetical protein